MTVPGGQLTRLTNDLSDYSAISLAVDRTSLVTARIDRRVGVWMADSNGANLREVVPMRTESAVFRAQLGWVGTRLAFTRGSGIWAIEAAGGAPVELVAEGLSPSGSANGKTMLYSSMGTNGSDTGIRQLSLDTGTISRLEDRPTRARLAPDVSGYLAISATKQTMVWTPLGGGPARELNQEFVPGQAFDVSRDGKRAVWTSPTADVTYSYCELPACTTVKSLKASRRALGVIRLTPDNTGVAYIDESRQNIWLQPLDGRPAFPLTSFRDMAVQDFDWSYDGKLLAIMRSETRQDIVMIKGLR
jgi:hypothetical protein